MSLWEDIKQHKVGLILGILALAATIFSIVTGTR
jgi:hypothetical protein